MATNLKRVTATGLAVPGPLYLKSVVLTAGASAAATAAVQDSASGGGTDVLSLAAVANTSALWRTGDPDGVFLSAGAYVTLSGTGASAIVEYER